MGIAPQAPEPPFLTFALSLASTSWSLYFLAISAIEGPTPFAAGAWQAAQLFFVKACCNAAESLAAAGFAGAVAAVATAAGVLATLVT